MFNIERILGLKHSNFSSSNDENDEPVENNVLKRNPSTDTSKFGCIKTHDFYLKNFKGYFWQPLDSDKKKYRTSFSRAQLEKLEACFENAKYLTVRDRVVLSKNLKLTDNQIKTWYQNRRTKWKKEISKAPSYNPYPFKHTASSDKMNDDEDDKDDRERYLNTNNITNTTSDAKHNSGNNNNDNKNNNSENFEGGDESLFEIEEKSFESITDPHLYSLVKRWYFNIFMHAYATPYVKI